MSATIEAQARDAALFKALGDPTRLTIVAELARLAPDEDLCACHIEARFDLAQATISHHLKVLRTAGWISSERRGTWHHYRLEPEAIARLGDFLDRLRCAEPLTSSTSCC